jgi:hypothetical protein
MLYGIRRLIMLAALGTVVACGRTTAPEVVAIVTPAPVPSTATSPDATPGAEPTPFTIPGVLACRAADLDVVVKVANPSYVGAGPMNTSGWDLTMTDVGSRPCFVGPTPDVSFFTSSRQISIPKDPPWPGAIVYLSPPAREPSPPFFGTATGEIDVNPCHLAQPVETMLVSLGETLDSVRVTPGPAAGWGTSCPVAGETYFTELYGVPNDGSIGGYAPRTETTVTAPPSARPGERVNFTVTLVNQAAASLGIGTPPINPTWTFARCPMFYDEVEGVVGTFRTSLLDCANAKPIPAGGSETFDMHIDIPTDAKPGPATLIWSIFGSPALYQEGTSYLPIA